MESGLTVGVDLTARLMQSFAELKVAKVNVGWFESAVYPNETPVAYVAAIQDQGSPINNIPARPIFEPTVDENKEAWAKYLRSAANAILNNKINVEDSLAKVGQRASDDVAHTIAGIHDPALAPATIRARLRKRADKKTVGNLDKPLIDTGLLYQTVNFEVEVD